ncbi:MAG: hypothetical protein HC830_12115, partial [Bacteroidetes bacterium]|nr:hypothetical protein [Bacteroidota bacterium]
MDVLNTIDAKLDEVKAYIGTLQGAATSEQLDVILGMLNSAKDKASSVLAEADALDEVA